MRMVGQSIVAGASSIHATKRLTGHGPTRFSLGGSGEYDPLLGKQRVDPIDYRAPPKAVLAASASAGEMSFVRSNSEMT
jgi:hypothetical protein